MVNLRAFVHSPNAPNVIGAFPISISFYALILAPIFTPVFHSVGLALAVGETKIDKRSIAGVLPNSTIFSRCFKINCANGIRTGQTELHALHKEQAYGNSLNSS